MKTASAHQYCATVASATVDDNSQDLGGRRAVTEEVGGEKYKMNIFDMGVNSP